MATYTLRWVASVDADASTVYNIYTDEGTRGTFVLESTDSSSNRGDGSYSPYTTTLASLVTDSATSITVASATNFSSGDYVMIGGEVIVLGTPTGATFNGCTRGAGGSVPLAHDSGATVYKMHESASVSVTFTGRHVITCLVKRENSGSESVAAETKLVSPILPPNNNYSTVYGVLSDVQGNSLNNIAVTLSISTSGAYIPGSGLSIYKEVESTTTDQDGYFQFFVPRSDSVELDARTITLTIGTGASEIVWDLTSIPNVDAINFLEV
jgi:predicted RecA/RadA family phage recombinase